ncbi:rubisco accumulation factor 1, chloroplastic-like [Phoenix dactylifera]|uniref:Rubisco accumulation factor 1, chloroplastic-like n=1 Tax=Phoenix dactylifera TaxID=42345 RepID=A0A8B7BGA4_PHODC|nr:rubisco accumulation factor 1, chloroplastic-like [Phoenix dactylifera]
MAMLSLTSPKLTNPFFQTHQHHQLQLHRHHHQQKMKSVGPISATKIPFLPTPSSSSGELYQPFRPPPSPLPKKYRSLDPAERLDILRNRMGLWHEYAPLIPALANDGFSPPSIEEATGISGVEQNSLIVASQVRDSLLSSSFDPDLLAFFDAGSGADLLYELRLLNAAQRAAAARRVVEQRLDPKGAKELARAVKDFPRRRGDSDWARFSASHPGDCLAYTHFRLSREALSAGDRIAALERAMEAAETEGARKRIEEEMEKAAGGGREGIEESEGAGRVTVPVVRLRYGEVAEATSVALLPVCRAGEGAEGVAAAPGWCRAEGELGVVAAERGWGRWMVLPGWGPVAAVGKGGGVAVEFGDGRVLPWKASIKSGMEEAVLVVADRGRREVAEEDGFYLVAEGEKGELGVESGDKLLEKGVEEALGTVVLVVRPPKEEEDDQLADEDWE